MEMIFHKQEHKISMEMIFHKHENKVSAALQNRSELLDDAALA
jgi:hypothetical protein